MKWQNNVRLHTFGFVLIYTSVHSLQQMVQIDIIITNYILPPFSCSFFLVIVATVILMIKCWIKIYFRVPKEKYKLFSPQYMTHFISIYIFERLWLVLPLYLLVKTPPSVRQKRMRCWSMSPKSSTTDCPRKSAWREGSFVGVRIVKLVHFIYMFFYTYYSVELWILWNALYFSMSRGNIVTPTSVVHTFFI